MKQVVNKRRKQVTVWEEADDIIAKWSAETLIPKAGLYYLAAKALDEKMISERHNKEDNNDDDKESEKDGNISAR